MRRKNAGAIPWLRSVAFFAVTLAALVAVPFYPAWLRPPLAAGCAALGLLAPAVGVFAFVVALAVPLAAGNVAIGVLFLVVGLAAVQYLGQDDAKSFLIIGLAFAASLLHAEWAMAAIAGYVLGASDGATAAFIAAALIEVAAMVLGKTSLGVLAGGGTAALVDVKRTAALADPLAFRWLGPAFASVNVDALTRTLSAVRHLPLLVAQPVIWALGAAVAGKLRQPPGEDTRRLSTVAGGAAGAVVVAGASFAAMVALKGPVPTAAFVPAAIASIALATGVIAAGEYLFTRSVAVEETPARPGSIRADDADVDELLRMISTAEEALENRHAIDAVVMITDMKAFSRITQEQGTVSTAKLIQRHRDLLLPLITKAGGKGKSTGGDGLVASFASADDALKATVDIQRALRDYNDGKPDDKRILIRVGVASGDIIVDRMGCPFIGDALNLAARVMGLADGGQAFVTHEVVDASTSLPSPVISHGEYSLKNITRRVDIYEVLWDEEQEPRRPSELGAA